MDFATNFPFFCIILTMTAGIISVVLKAQAAFYLNVCITSICLTLNGILLYFMYISPQQITFMMGHYPAPWGNEIRFGPFEVLLATVFCLVMLMSCLTEKARIFRKIHDSKLNLFYLMMNLLLSSTLALVYTNDLFTAYVFVEINTLCACGFVASKNTRKAIAATIKYLIMSLLGSGLFLISIILMYVLTGHLLMPNVRESIDVLMQNGDYIMPITIIVGLLAVSIAIKSALYPFHNWVPNAYDRAFNLSNALSSGLVLKSYIILLIKIFYRVLGLENIAKLEVINILFIFGLLSMVFASVHAVTEINIKKILSYSSIAQIGYIYVAIGLGTTSGFIAATYIIIAHALVKSMLFTSCEGLMESSLNTKHADGLKGSAYRNPIAGIAFTVGSFSMIGFPLLGGFYSKYLLALAAIGSPIKMWFVLIALIISTVLNAIYFLRIIQTIYAKSEKVEVPKISLRYRVSMCVFIGINVCFGFSFSYIVRIIESGLSLL